jgi:hypothetical protein
VGGTQNNLRMVMREGARVEGHKGTFTVSGMLSFFDNADLKQMEQMLRLEWQYMYFLTFCTF